MYKRKIVTTGLDKTIDELVMKSDHKVLGIWAADCAERVLPYFEKKSPHDDRPRKAIASVREWVRTGVFKMTTVRKASLDAHAAARSVTQDDVARSAARAAGQAAATPHVPRHALGAARYAATVIRNISEPNQAEVAIKKEQEWQYAHLQKLSGNMS